MHKYFNGYTSELLTDVKAITDMACTPLTRMTTNNSGDYTLFPAIHKTQKGCLCLNCYQAIMDEYWSKVNGESLE